MAKYLCGVDLGGTKLSVGIFLPDGTLVEKRVIFEHRTMEKEGITESIISLIKDLMKYMKINDEDLFGIGIGVAGHINFRKGVIITSSNFSASFSNYPLRDLVAKRFNTNVIIDNDANAQAYGELCFGAGRDYSDIVFITVSTGIGSGIIIDKKLIRGMTGTAGEIGHTIIDPNSSIQCTCGNYGCLMALSCGQSFPDLYKKYIQQGLKSSLNLDKSNTHNLDGILLKEGIISGDEVCLNILQDSANIIGTGLYNLFQILNPEVFILGGGLINIGDIYTDLIKNRFLSLVKKMMYDNVELKISALGNNAGLIGAAALTLEKR
jgi:glucokinase